jgi:aminopeptidase N
VYLRGAMFLEDLKVLIGEEAFNAFLLEYLNQYTYKQATANGFFALLENYTDADLNGLLNEYFTNR